MNKKIDIAIKTHPIFEVSAHDLFAENILVCFSRKWAYFKILFLFLPGFGVIVHYDIVY